MKNIFKIYKNDIKTIWSNWAARTIVIGLILIPSLYSLVNIKASWDPYANTGGIKIAVVNNDKGTVFKEQDINMGDELVDKLKDNDKMGWEFVDKDTAESGLILEKYYATIEIPEDFSEDVTTLMDKEVVKPKLIYTVNEKKNAIAPKLTDAGVKSVKTQLDENIAKTVSGIMFRLLNESGVELEGKRTDIRKIIDDIYELDEKIPEFEGILDDTINSTADVDTVLNKANDMIPTVSTTLDNTNDFFSDINDSLDRSQSHLSDISPIIKNDLVLSENLLDNMSISLKNIDENILPETAEKTLISISESAKATRTTVSESKEMLKSVRKFLNKVIDFDISKINLDKLNIDSDAVKELQNEFDDQYEALENIQDNLKDIKSVISNLINKMDTIDEKLNILITRVDNEVDDLKNGKELDTQTLKDTINLVDDTHTLVSDIIDSYDSEIVSSIEDGFTSSKYIVQNSLSILKVGQSILPDLENVLNSSMDISNYSRDELIALKDKFPELKDKIHEIADKLREMDEDEQFDEILDMITNNWDNQSDFLSSTVKIEDNRLFSWPNYGAASAPFYLVLCLWVGALISAALLSKEAKGFGEEIKIRPYEVYLGKLLTFLTVSMLGAIVVSIGAIVFLKVYAVHPVLVVFYNMFLSVVFTIIIYTAVTLLDSVGESIIVVLLVFQMAGTSGTFPVEVTPEMFQKVYPYLPFTYATNGLRQVMAGIVYPMLIRDIKILLIYMMVPLIIGTLFKGILNKGTNLVKEMISKSGILKH